MKAAVSIDTISNANWQLSNFEFGQVAIGDDDILMCVHNILFTRKGELPLNAQAGSNLYKLVDKPLNIIMAGVSAEVIGAINEQEPRVSVSQVVPNFNAQDGSVEFGIYMTNISTGALLGYRLSLSKSVNGLRSFSGEFTNDFG